MDTSLLFNGLNPLLSYHFILWKLVQTAAFPANTVTTSCNTTPGHICYLYIIVNDSLPLQNDEQNDANVAETILIQQPYAHYRGPSVTYKWWRNGTSEIFEIIISYSKQIMRKLLILHIIMINKLPYEPKLIHQCSWPLIQTLGSLNGILIVSYVY